MLAQFSDVPSVEVVGDPQSPLMLIPFSAGFRGWVDPPDIGGREFPDEVFLDEQLDSLFAQATGREGPYGRSFPFDLDGDILDGLLGHSEQVWCVLWLRRTERLLSDRLPEKTQSCVAVIDLHPCGRS